MGSERHEVRGIVGNLKYIQNSTANWVNILLYATGIGSSSHNKKQYNYVTKS